MVCYSSTTIKGEFNHLHASTNRHTHTNTHRCNDSHNTIYRPHSEQLTGAQNRPYFWTPPTHTHALTHGHTHRPPHTFTVGVEGGGERCRAGWSDISCVCVQSGAVTLSHQHSIPGAFCVLLAANLSRVQPPLAIQAPPHPPTPRLQLPLST